MAIRTKISKDLFEARSILIQQKVKRLSKPSLNFWQDAWLRVRKNKGAIVSLVVLAIITIMAFVGPI